jgi:HEPN domain-containing protein
MKKEMAIKLSNKLAIEAKNDLSAAKVLLNSHYSQAVLLSQMAAEKIIKAYLLLLTGVELKTHKIYTYAKCGINSKIENEAEKDEILHILNKYKVLENLKEKPRFPVIVGNKILAPNDLYGAAEAKRYYDRALVIFDKLNCCINNL